MSSEDEDSKNGSSEWLKECPGCGTMVDLRDRGKCHECMTDMRAKRVNLMRERANELVEEMEQDLEQDEQKKDDEVEGKVYRCGVTCLSCGFRDIITISRKIAVQNAKCPECGNISLERGM